METTTQPKKIEPRELADALREANAAASKASREYLAQHALEGGSCNLDSIILRVPKGTRDATVKAAAKLAGVDVSDTTWCGRGYFLAFDIAGQAFAREKGCEAARHALTARGFETSYYSQMD